MAESYPYRKYTDPSATEAIRTGKAGESGMGYLGVASTALGAMATLSDQERENQAIMDNMGSLTKEFMYSQSHYSKRLEDIERVASDAMSAEGLEALKRESTLRASSAETGATGASNAEAMAQAEMQRLHTGAVIKRNYEVQKVSTMQNMLAEELSFVNALETTRQGMDTPLNAFLGTLNSSINGMQLGLQFLGQSDGERFFGTDVKSPMSQSQAEYIGSKQKI